MRILARAILLLPLLVGCRLFIASPEECAASCDAPTTCCTGLPCPASMGCSAMPAADRAEAPSAPHALVATSVPVSIAPASLVADTSPRAAAGAGSSPLWLELRRLRL